MGPLSCVIGCDANAKFAIDILPLNKDAFGALTPARLLMLVSELRVREAIDIARLRGAFRLTNSEATFLAKFNVSHDVAETAQALGIAKETARTHLRSIFQKTGTNKQSEVISLMSRLGPRPRAMTGSAIADAGGERLLSIVEGRPSNVMTRFVMPTE